MSAKIKDVEIRQATAQDIRDFYSFDCPRTSYVWVALYKGIPACIAGLTIGRGGCVAFSEVKAGIDAPKRTIWLTAVALMEHIRSLKLPMYAACEFHDKMAQKFVRKLGFIRQRNLQGAELFVWQE